MKGLNDQQSKAVLQTEGPVLILAGAGSGKTRVLTHRIAYLIEEKGVNPYHILAITFTNKAAKEMRERVDRAITFASDQIWVSTFHSSCVRWLRRYIDRLGYDTRFTIYDYDDQKSVLRAVCKKLDIDTKKYKERTLLSGISNAKDELKTPLDLEIEAMGDYTKKTIAAVYKEYQNTLQRNNALDFDDLIMKTVQLFKSSPEVLQSMHNHFHYIMVDEYQDTNTAQFELIRLLSSGSRNLCVVGDDDQSIYKFRGANIRNILDFEKVYPDACVIKLEQNYRSTKTILQAANSVIANNLGRKSKELWTDKSEGSKVHFRKLDSAREEADFVAEDIKRKVRASIATYKECAVLYRTNAQSRSFEEQFILDAIPYKVVGGINFYSRKEIKDILSYLKTIDNAADDLAVKRIINVPKRGIGLTSIQRIEEYAAERQIHFFDACQEAMNILSLGKASEKVRRFATEIENYRSRLPRVTLLELVTGVLADSGYVEELKSQEEGDELTDRLQNIDELLAKVAYYDQENSEPTLGSFLEEVALVADIDSVNDDDNRVLVMTMHSAKGLEFDHVYIVGMEDGLFPGYVSIGDSEELEEERRLAYVGMTRAREDLTLSCAGARMLHGETKYNPVSRFVKEIPQELLDGRLPERRFGDADLSYAEESAERTRFMTMPYQTNAIPNAKPKAFVRKAVTPPEQRPFIAQGLGGISQLPGVTRGASMSESLEYGVGDRVFHQKFGEGTVTEIESGPKDYLVSVQFDEYGAKNMYAAFARLQKK